MKKMKHLCIVILVFSLLACKSKNSDNIHPFEWIGSYNGSVLFSIEDRLLNTPEIIIASLNELDNVTNYSSYELSVTEKQLFMDYFELIPEVFKETITDNVIGIYFVNNFLGGGMTLPIFNTNGDMYIVLFFNPKILFQSITEWINYRDNSVFKDNSNNISLTVECYSQYGIQYALLHTLIHEACHVYDYYYNATPYVEVFLKNEETILPGDFIKDIWIDIDKPIEIFDYTNRENISFYDLGEKMDKGNAIEIYSKLINTPFSSMYGSKTWAEDFAEAFTWYYLNRCFGINYITVLQENNEIKVKYDPNENELVKKRYEIFENILKK